MPSALLLVRTWSADAPTQKDIEDFADAEDLNLFVCQLIEQHAARAAALRNRGGWRCV